MYACCLVLSLQTRLLFFAIQICTHSDFELIVMLLIATNCVSLALFDPLQPEDSLHNGTLTKLGAAEASCLGWLLCQLGRA